MSAESPVALVTGASRGIGRAIAIELAGAGYDIGINFARREEEARAVAESIVRVGRQALLLRGDVGKREDRSSLLASLRQGLGRIDLLVNSAAVAPRVRADILEAGEEGFDEVMAVNLKGAYFLTQAVARWMLEIRREHPERRLSIINISSISEYAPSVNRGDYCIAKAGLGMVTKLFAVRLAGDGIRVNEVRPGIIATDMTAPVKEKYDRLIADGLTPIRRWGAPEDVARAVRALAGAELEFSTGMAVDVDGGFHLRPL